MMQIKSIQANSKTDMFITGTYKKDYVAPKLINILKHEVYANEFIMIKQYE